MKKIESSIVIASLLIASTTSFAQGPRWEPVNKSTFEKQATDLRLTMKTINIEAYREHWLSSPTEDSKQKGLSVWLPTPSGESLEFYVWESPIMEQGLADKYPSIKTYKGHQKGNPNNQGRFDMVNGAFHGVYSLNNEKVFIDPVELKGGRIAYKVFNKSDFAKTQDAKLSRKAFQCKVKGHQHSALDVLEKFASKAIAAPINLGDTLRTYRLAVATTGEYGKFFGTKAKAVESVVSAVNRVNEVFQKDFAVKLELVAENDKIVYIDPASDPFQGNDDGGVLIDESGTEINKTIGNANYDVGHVFSTGGGGLAGLGVVCSSSKADGVTGSGNPTGDPYWIDYVAHELGHQFNAEHSFNANSSSCQGNRAGQWSYEPGSGSTIMGYANLCGEEDLQSAADAYFHTTSIEQIKSHITGSADSCANKSSLSNAIPAVDAGKDFNIPKETPFKLTASATDADTADSLTYGWEQRDLGAASTSAATLIDDGKRPIFRSWEPAASPTRYLPRLNEVLSGGALIKGEAYATTTRDLNFVVTVRDQKGGINSDATLIKVDSNAGPFKAKFPTSSSNWAPSSQQYAQWDVSNTTAAPISCATVDVKLSLDDGQTFDTLVSGTANDGQELVTLPAAKTGDKARFFVECSSQPFFAVTQAFKISTAGLATTEDPGNGGSANNAPVVVADAYSVNQDTSNNRFDLLVNDSDSDGDTFKVTQVTAITDGATVTISSDGQYVNYTATAGFSGNSSFNYEIADSKGAKANGAVSIEVKATVTNSAPVANADSYTVDYNSSNNSLTLLANDSDPDAGDTIKINSVSSITNGATVTVATDGQSVTYSPATNFSGAASFSYQLIDSQGATSEATVNITVSAAPAPVTPPTGGGGSGGGSAGLFLLGLLLIRQRIKSIF